MEPWGRLVEGGREGCDRGSIVTRGRVEDGQGMSESERRKMKVKTDHKSIIEHVSNLSVSRVLPMKPKKLLVCSEIFPEAERARGHGNSLKRKI